MVTLSDALHIWFHSFNCSTSKSESNKSSKCIPSRCNEELCCNTIGSCFYQNGYLFLFTSWCDVGKKEEKFQKNSIINKIFPL